ncbi:hypothetical protein [Bowmanella yangjiangensis]|uniref:Uncharacterized protein n=1 Tax=Bowmanella yangjiangensis TaxID=2811230 RepID=A0ABS3CYG8_9ALTE|nr:hypothetical protein [Bowmanella yangjiangensis]MBN7822138.1 hypothetical protein [Bowmanella yangjiangensis]
MEPDFFKYDIEELQECLRSIDRERYPERVAEIEQRLKALLAEEAKRIEAIPPEERAKIEKQSRNGSYLIIFICLFFCTLFLYTGEIPLRHSEDVTVKESPIMFYALMVFFVFMAVWQALTIYMNRFK